MGLRKSDFKSPSGVKEQRGQIETPADSILIFKKPDFHIFFFLSCCDKQSSEAETENAELFCIWPFFLSVSVCLHVEDRTESVDRGTRFSHPDFTAGQHGSSCLTPPGPGT